MKLPYIILVDDDIQVLRAIQRDIRNKYRDEYKIAATESAIEALELIKELKLKTKRLLCLFPISACLKWKVLPFLSLLTKYSPMLKNVLLTAYSDIEAAIKAINNVKLDYYLLKPWHPAEEKLFPVVNDLLDEWHRAL